MISNAEKHAATTAIHTEDQDVRQYAQSAMLPFELVSKVANHSIPLRRPNRSVPLDTVTSQLDSLEPNGLALSSLAAKYAAPQEWFEED
jgi:hypothetical protein